jgi:hypothetical protein
MDFTTRLKVWEKPLLGETLIQRWDDKMRATRKHLGGWARHTSSVLTKEKLRMSSNIDRLKEAADVRSLYV